MEIEAESLKYQDLSKYIYPFEFTLDEQNLIYSLKPILYVSLINNQQNDEDFQKIFCEVNQMNETDYNIQLNRWLQYFAKSDYIYYKRLLDKELIDKYIKVEEYFKHVLELKEKFKFTKTTLLNLRNLVMIVKNRFHLIDFDLETIELMPDEEVLFTLNFDDVKNPVFKLMKLISEERSFELIEDLIREYNNQLELELAQNTPIPDEDFEDVQIVGVNLEFRPEELRAIIEKEGPVYVYQRQYLSLKRLETIKRHKDEFGGHLGSFFDPIDNLFTYTFNYDTNQFRVRAHGKDLPLKTLENIELSHLISETKISQLENELEIVSHAHLPKDVEFSEQEIELARNTPLLDEDPFDLKDAQSKYVKHDIEFNPEELRAIIEEEGPIYVYQRHYLSLKRLENIAKSRSLQGPLLGSSIKPIDELFTFIFDGTTNQYRVQAHGLDLPLKTLENYFLPDLMILFQTYLEIIKTDKLVSISSKEISLVDYQTYKEKYISEKKVKLEDYLNLEFFLKSVLSKLEYMVEKKNLDETLVEEKINFLDYYKEIVDAKSRYENQWSDIHLTIESMFEIIGVQLYHLGLSPEDVYKISPKEVLSFKIKDYQMMDIGPIIERASSLTSWTPLYELNLKYACLRYWVYKENITLWRICSYITWKEYFENMSELKKEYLNYDLINIPNNVENLVLNLSKQYSKLDDFEKKYQIYLERSYAIKRYYRNEISAGELQVKMLNYQDSKLSRKQIVSYLNEYLTKEEFNRNLSTDKYISFQHYSNKTSPFRLDQLNEFNDRKLRYQQRIINSQPTIVTKYDSVRPWNYYWTYGETISERSKIMINWNIPFERRNDNEWFVESQRVKSTETIKYGYTVIRKILKTDVKMVCICPYYKDGRYCKHILYLHDIGQIDLRNLKLDLNMKKKEYNQIKDSFHSIDTLIKKTLINLI